MEKRTQLQLRIKTSVRTGETYQPNTYFIDLHDYQERNFIDKRSFLSTYLSEEDVKFGTSSEVGEKNSSVQARLAQMEYGNDLIKILTNNHNKKGKLNLKGLIKLSRIESRNNRLMGKAVNKAIKRKGGLIYLVIKSYAMKTMKIEPAMMISYLRTKDFANKFSK